MRCEILCTGSELVEGRTSETNASWIIQKLAPLGIQAARVTILPDDARAITQEIREALARVRCVILTGGLGPTRDDVTRQAIARAAHRPLAEHPAARAALARWFAGRVMPVANRNQALMPQGAEPLANPAGTAPGIWISLPGGKTVASVPGVPHEMRRMIEEEVIPRLAGRAGPARAVRQLSVFGLSEAAVDAQVERLPKGVRYGITVRGIRVQLTFSAPARRRLAVEETARRLERILGRQGGLVLAGDADLAVETHRRLVRARATLAVAESCTGGRVAAMLTAVPGMSKVLIESVVTYANLSKIRRLRVSRVLLRRSGAVSHEVAAAMARGARKTSGADYALAVTGIAGPACAAPGAVRSGAAGRPEGETPEKPVGLVWLGFAGPGGVEATSLHLKGDRETIQTRAAEWALLFLLRSTIHELRVNPR